MKKKKKKKKKKEEEGEIDEEEEGKIGKEKLTLKDAQSAQQVSK